MFLHICLVATLYFFFVFVTQSTCWLSTLSSGSESSDDFMVSGEAHFFQSNTHFSIAVCHPGPGRERASFKLRQSIYDEPKSHCLGSLFHNSNENFCERDVMIHLRVLVFGLETICSLLCKQEKILLWSATGLEEISSASRLTCSLFTILCSKLMETMTQNK